MIAAIYARFSSDAQRDESIEIQVAECRRLIEREGWTVGEVYADHAMTGRNDRRPSFQRMLADGEAGAFDVLVIYKSDRFARSVEVSRRCKRRLREAGVRIVSCREGESKDTPDGFLHEAMDEAFAEYYSRNLSVMVRNGIDASARKGLASGRRVYGYSVVDDRFVEDVKTAPVVRRIFSEYLSGATVKEVADGLNADAVPAPRGGRWRTQTLGWILRYAGYTGLYRYAGVEIEGGMPALVSREDFDEVRRRLASKCRRRPNREQEVADYTLTGKAFCLECGEPVAGTCGHSHTGKVYRYYRCHAGCGKNVPKGALETAVAEAVRDVLSDETEVGLMVAAVMEEQRSGGELLASLEAQEASLKARADRLVESVADGMPYALVKEKVEAVHAELAELEPRLRSERAARAAALDEGKVRAALEYFVSMIPEVERFRAIAVRDYVNSVFVGDGVAVVVFSTDRQDVPPLEYVRELLNEKTPCSQEGEGVRIATGWWASLDSGRTLYHGSLFCRVVIIP